jgi:hypothetical protein
LQGRGRCHRLRCPQGRDQAGPAAGPTACVARRGLALSLRLLRGGNSCRLCIHLPDRVKKTPHFAYELPRSCRELVRPR